jgi:hypothetical protein
MKQIENNFEILLILARPAAGKSEIIQYLKRLKDDDRRSRFHIGKIHVIDDFPMLWSWFEEDDLLTKLGYPRLYTDQNGYFLKKYYWDLLIERMNLEYSKFIRDDHNPVGKTVIIEFSRGREHGGYKSAFTHISGSILEKAVILYVNVSREESVRKNRLRFNPDKPDSILEHSLSDEKMARLYRDIDWEEIASKKDGNIQIGSVLIPFEIFENEDDVTSGNICELDERLHSTLDKLWTTYQNKY